jgi:hypothetical protein
MTDQTEPLGIAIDAEYAPIARSESLLARFLMRELQCSDSINDLLALFDGPQQSVARRLAGCRPLLAPGSDGQPGLYTRRCGSDGR